MTADVTDVVRARVPWADLAGASPLLDVRQASRAGYNASGLARMSQDTFRLLEGNANPADLWGRRSTTPGGAPAVARLFRYAGLPVPSVDPDIPGGRVVLYQDGLPVLTIDVGG